MVVELNNRHFDPVPVTDHRFATISATSQAKRLCVEVLASAWRVIEEVTFMTGNLADAIALPIWHAGADAKRGLIFCDRKEEIERCASRRWLR
jgi:hypothetical protein